MKVLIVSAHVDLPEAHIFVGLAQRGVSFRVWCEPSSPHQEMLRNAGIIVEHHTFRSRFDFKATRSLRREIADSVPAYDIVHFFSNRALSNGLIACWSLPQITVAYRGTVGHLSRFDPLSWLTYLSPRLNGIVCVSAAVERFLSGLGIADKKLRTIHKGHRVEWYATPSSSRQTLNIPDGAPVIACAANFRPVKGGQYLIESFLALDHSFDAHLLLIGDVRDPAVTKLLNVNGGNTRIHALGFRKDVSSLIGIANIFVMPSVDREGLPKAVIEAMAKGVPPVVTSVGGLPELVEEGVSGLLVPPRSASHLTAALSRLLQDVELRTKLGRGAVARIEGAFSVERSIEHTFNWYRELIGAAKQPRT